MLADAHAFTENKNKERERAREREREREGGRERASERPLAATCNRNAANTTIIIKINIKIY